MTKAEAGITLDAVAEQQNKQYGSGTIFNGTGLAKDPPRVPTGVFTLDYCTGGGVPLYGSLCFWGPEGGSKTTLALSVAAMVGKICWRCFNMLEFCSCSRKALQMRTAWSDVEGTLDRGWAAAVGAEPETYKVILADYGEQYINIAEAVLRADDCGLLVMDSLGALIPSVEMEQPSEDQFIGNQAKMITRCVRKLKQRLILERKRDHPCCIVFTNQIRKKIGQMFGDPESMAGGHAMLHEFSLVLRCVKKALTENDKSKFLDDKRSVNRAQRHSFAIRKEKVLTLAGVGEYVRVREPIPELELRPGMVDDYNTVLSYAKEYQVLTKEKGTWHFMGHTAKRESDIKTFWKRRPAEYYRVQKEIIQKAKERLR